MKKKEAMLKRKGKRIKEITPLDVQKAMDKEDAELREKMGATKCPHCGIDKRELDHCPTCEKAEEGKDEKPLRIPGTDEDGMPVMMGASKHNRAIYERIRMTPEQLALSVTETDENGQPKKPGKKGGRPPIDRKKALHYLCEAFRLDATDEEACSYAGVSERWFYDEMKASEEFLQEIRRAQRYPFLIAKGSVVGAMEVGNDITGLKYLERRQKKLYSPRVEVTGEDGEAVKIDVLTEAKKRSKKYSTPKR